MGSQALRVSIVCPYLPSASETFIRAHVDRLPAQVTLIHGWRPTVGSRFVLSPAARLRHRILRAVARVDVQREITAAYTHAFWKYRPEVVLAEYGDTGVDVMAACERSAVPLVVHFHGYDATVHDVLRRHARTYPRMFEVAAGVVAVSRSMRTDLLALGCPESKLHYNPYGVDLSQFSGADPARSAPVFVAVGRLVEKKAPLATIAAFKIAQQHLPGTRLRIIGDGELRTACEQIIRQLRLGDLVTLLGTQSPAVVADELRGARAFVQHSIRAASGDAEGTPVAILEAGAAGLPVIATRHTGIVDVVVNGETGLLVDEGDVVGMAEAMLRLGKDPSLAAAFGTAARTRISTEFSLERSLTRLTAILAECAGRRN
jgi:colanic acid/amylovoran biosynthesis glycosyltransferase